MKEPLPILLVAAVFSALACAPRAHLCSGPVDCKGDFACIAGQCLRKGAIPAISVSRRILVAPDDVAALLPGDPSAGGALPAVFTLGRGSDRGAMLLLSFDLHRQKIQSILRASVLLDRSEAVPPDAVPISLYADAVLAHWDPRTVRSCTAPPLEDVRSPRTFVGSSDRRVVRVDVTDMTRRWLARDSAFHGLAIVAENASTTGVTFATGETSLPELDSRRAGSFGRDVRARGPRLELYVR